MIDSNSILNFIFQHIVDKLNVFNYFNNFMTMIITNEIKISFFEYTKIEIITTSISKIIQIWIISRNIIYVMILRKSWLKNISIVEFYEIDEYWIQDMNEKYKQLKMMNFEIFKNKKIFMRKIEINSIAMRFFISIKKKY